MMNKVILFIKNRRGKIVVWTMVVCLLISTVGRAVPIYFVNNEIAEGFKNFVFYLTITSVWVATFHSCYRANDENWWSSAAVAASVSFLTFIVLWFIGFFDGFSSFSDAEVLYSKNGNSKVKIVKQYVDSGALGDGYRTVLRRELTSFLKYEVIIDTNTINKNEWIKQ